MRSKARRTAQEKIERSVKNQMFAREYLSSARNSGIVEAEIASRRSGDATRNDNNRAQQLNFAHTHSMEPHRTEKSASTGGWTSSAKKRSQKPARYRTVTKNSMNDPWAHQKKQ